MSALASSERRRAVASTASANLLPAGFPADTTVTLCALPGYSPLYIADGVEGRDYAFLEGGPGESWQRIREQIQKPADACRYRPPS